MIRCFVDGCAESPKYQCQCTSALAYMCRNHTNHHTLDSTKEHKITLSKSIISMAYNSLHESLSKISTQLIETSNNSIKEIKVELNKNLNRILELEKILGSFFYSHQDATKNLIEPINNAIYNQGIKTLSFFKAFCDDVENISKTYETNVLIYDSIRNNYSRGNNYRQKYREVNNRQDEEEVKVLNNPTQADDYEEKWFIKIPKGPLNLLNERLQKQIKDARNNKLETFQIFDHGQPYAHVDLKNLKLYKFNSHGSTDQPLCLVATRKKKQR
ncbi:hypothetical protein SteCoe_21332 [Stentor coeruleus]|uniref:Uncharacterized protein n=1 Tax=Stentor coeruleus TaxID=5963 RepID=A0A1R2BPZ1_9CILI|nr:hypothetical protein SteCoe_21332 [Stentor coeruleus]